LEENFLNIGKKTKAKTLIIFIRNHRHIKKITTFTGHVQSALDNDEHRYLASRILRHGSVSASLTSA